MKVSHDTAPSRPRFGVLLLTLLGATALPLTAGAAPVVLTPASGNALTCSTVQMRSTAPGTWTLGTANAGNIVPTGVYTAPVKASVSSVNIQLTNPTANVSTQLQIATAFPSAPSVVPLGGNTNGIGNGAPFEHTFSNNGQRVYTVAQGAVSSATNWATNEIDVYVSNDGGQTFAPAYATGQAVKRGSVVRCATIAADAGNPDVAYLTYYATAPGTTTVGLSVSTDGGKTFATDYSLASSTSSPLAPTICPDVVSPSPDHVVVSFVNSSQNTVATWTSSTRGSGARDTSSAVPASTCHFLSNNLYDGPRLFANATGTVCLAYTSDPVWCSSNSELYIKCSKDSGATWTAASTLDQANGLQATHNPVFGAVSRNGTVAVSYLRHIGANDESIVRISTNGGASFGPGRPYPTELQMGVVASSTVTRPVVAWENDSTLWLAQTLNERNAPVLFVDKICDVNAGTIWSGPLKLGSYIGMSLLATGRGIVAGGYVPNQSRVAIGLANGVVH
jgi:hypothetical protein